MDTLMFDGAPDALIGMSVRGMVEYWSKGAERTFGYASEETLGRDLTELIVPEDRIKPIHLVLNECATSGGRADDFMFRHKDGSLMYVDLIFKAAPSTGSDIVLLVTTKKDVTHLRFMREVQMLEKRFGDAIESLPDAIVLMNHVGRVVLANTRAEYLFGYHHCALTGKPMEQLLPARYRVAYVEQRAAFFHQQVRTPDAGLDLFGLRADGTEFPIEISLTTLPSRDGLLVASTIRDVTARKRFEDLLQQKNRELVAANQAKDRFMASVTEALRAPLSSIVDCTGTLKLSGVAASNRETELSTLQASARQLLTMLEDRFDPTNVEAKQRDIEVEFADCRRFIDEVAGQLRLRAQAGDLPSPAIDPELFAARIERYLRPELRVARPARDS